MEHHSGSRRLPTPTTINGLRFQASPCVMRFQVSHVVGPFGVPHRTTPPSHTAPNKQLQAVFLRLSPSCGLTQARNHSSHAPRTQHTPSSALPTPAPRARRTYNFCCSRAARTSRTQATPGHTHMRHKPTRTTRAATRPLSLRTNVRIGTEPRRRQSPFAPFYTRKARSAILQQQIRGTGCSCSCTRVRGGSLQKK